MEGKIKPKSLIKILPCPIEEKKKKKPQKTPNQHQKTTKPQKFHDAIPTLLLFLSQVTILKGRSVTFNPHIFSFLPVYFMGNLIPILQHSTVKNNCCHLYLCVNNAGHNSQLTGKDFYLIIIKCYRTLNILLGTMAKEYTSQSRLFN